MAVAVARAKGSGDGRGKGPGAGAANRNANGYWQQTMPKQTRYYPAPETTTSSLQKHHRFKSAPAIINSPLLFRDRDPDSDPNNYPNRRVSVTKQRHIKSWSERGSRAWPTTPCDDDRDPLDKPHKLRSKHPPDGGGSPRMIQCIEPPSRTTNECAIPDAPERDIKTLEPTPKTGEMERTLSMSNLESAAQQDAYPTILEAGANITDDRLWISSDERDWQKMRQLRLENWAFRSRAHEMRMALRKKQITKSSVEDRLFQLFRRKELGLALHANENDEEGYTISQLMEKNQEIRDEFGPLEDLCLQLEDELTEKESELTRLEQRFDKKWEKTPNNKVGIAAAEPSQDVMSSSGSSSLDEKEDYQQHPLVTQYFSTKGELNILRERLDEYFDEKLRLEDIRDSRKLVGLHLPTEDQIWLEQFPASEGKLRQDIKAMSDQVDLMRRDCLHRRLINDQDQVIDFQGQEKIAFIDEDLDVQDKVSEYVKYPHLLPKPGYKTEPVYGKFDTKSDRTTGFINHWLLDMLRTSPLEVNLLARTFEGKAGKMIDAWETSVLSFWYNDETNAGKIQVSTASMTTDAVLGTRQSTASRHSFGIFISSSMKLLNGSVASDSTKCSIYARKDHDSGLALR